MFKRLLSLFRKKDRYYSGVVTGIQFTYGSRGQQLTTIGGVTYWTWWNALDIDWKRDDTVTFKVRKIQHDILEAYEIHKAGAVE